MVSYQFRLTSLLMQVYQRMIPIAGV